jgi:hypothetical protein
MMLLSIPHLDISVRNTRDVRGVLPAFMASLVHGCCDECLVLINIYHSYHQYQQDDQFPSTSLLFSLVFSAMGWATTEDRERKKQATSVPQAPISLVAWTLSRLILTTSSLSRFTSGLRFDASHPIQQQISPALGDPKINCGNIIINNWISHVSVLWRLRYLPKHVDISTRNTNDDRGLFPTFRLYGQEERRTETAIY